MNTAVTSLHPSPLALLLLIASLWILPAHRLHAQLPSLDPCAAGTGYIIAFPDTTQNTVDDRFPSKLEDRFYLFLYSAADSNRVTITPKGGKPQTVILLAGKFNELWLKPEKVVDQIGAISNNTYRVDAQYPIIVYCYMVTRFGGEAWTPLPVEAWGTRYYMAGIPPTLVNDIFQWDEVNYGTREKPAPAEIMVVAAYDSTHVTITPNVPLTTPFNSVTLNAGQAYQWATGFDWPARYQGRLQADPGGSRIVSDKPIGVISGNTRHMVDTTEKMLSTNSIKTMMIESLTPAEQQGTEFAYLPSWDSRRIIPGLPSQRIDDKRHGEFVRIYGTSQSGTTSGSYTTGYADGSRVGFTVSERGVVQAKIDTPQGRYFKTDRPAQVMMHSSSASHYDSTFHVKGDYYGTNYTGWGPYMVELIPREQWTSFAPFYAPSDPYGVESFVNVVADDSVRDRIYFRVGTGPLRPFDFNHGRIVGSTLVWGEMQIAPGTDYYLIGDNGAKFSGFVYGFWRGYEQFQPGAIRKKDDGGGASIASGGGKGDGQILHPAEYYENVGISYGYPLPPSRCALVPPAVLGIDTAMGCTDLSIKVKLSASSNAGIRSITLDPAVTSNARLIFITPNSPAKLPQYRGPEVEVRVVPIDPAKDASTTVIIRDGSSNGKTYYIDYRYYVERLTLGASSSGVIDFGQVRINTTASRSFIVANPTPKAIVVKDLKLILANQSFVVDHTVPPLPDTLLPGEQLEVFLQSTPSIDGLVYNDTVRLMLGCSELKVPVRVQGVNPCITVGDLDFGTLDVGDSKTLPLVICNEGSSQVSFDDSTGNGVITWLDNNHFTVSPADKALLAGTKLDSGQCVTINVTFASTSTGPFSTTARLWANTRSCRDTSVWRAVVTKPGPQITGTDWHERWLTVRNACTKSGIPLYDSVVWISNTGVIPFTVAKIELIGADADAGYFALGVSPAVPAGTIIQPGDQFKLPQEVIFTPEAERSYSCIVKLTTDRGDTVANVLTGIGIESHVQISDADFGSSEFAGAGFTSVSRTATLTALPSRTLTVHELRIAGVDRTSFRFDLSGGFVPPVESDPTTWWTLAPGDSRQIPLLFTPSDSGSRSATIEAIGDHSRCDDSTGVLTGSTFMLSAQASGFSFGTLLTCDDSTGWVTITNSSSGTIKVTGAVLQDASGYFSLPPVGSFTLAPFESRQVPVVFAPAGTGAFSATVIFSLTNLDGTLDLGTVTAPVGGTGAIFEVGAHIDRNYRAFPGTPVTVAVQLDDPLDAAHVTDLDFSITYQPGMLMLTNDDPAKIGSMIAGTLLDRWTITPTAQSAGTFKAHLSAPAGSYLRGTGTLLDLDFLTFVGDIASSDLPFTIALDSIPCASVTASPGFIRLDSVCGIGFRLIEASSSKYSLAQNAPNPFNPTTEIEFSLGLDGQTTLTVYNAIGERVALLVDGSLQPGKYSVRWDASAYPSGLYYYRLSSGVWSQTGRMMLRK
jgi:hypothetical protein